MHAWRSGVLDGIAEAFGQIIDRRRLGFGIIPPSTSLARARTTYRPPCFAILSLTAATYGSSPGRLMISASQTT
jgi:hypothetical protein